MKFVKLEDDVTLPERGTGTSAGYDLISREDYELQPGERHLFNTSVAWEDTPAAIVGFIKPRSGLAYKHGIDTMAGVIDSDYDQGIGVILINHGDKPYKVLTGDKIAQLLLLQWFRLPNEDEVEQVREGGYGSTDEA